MKDLAAGERLGRKFTCAPFIPHGRGLRKLNLPVPKTGIKVDNSAVLHAMVNRDDLEFD